MTLQSPRSRSRTLVFYLIVSIIGLIPILLLGAFVARHLPSSAEGLMLKYARYFMTDEQKHQIYQRLAQSLPGQYDTVPEHLVGRILQPNTTKTVKQAEIVSNNAGMRDRRPYIEKTDDVFRIVCLGDSFVEGTAGREEDRFSNQMEEILLGINGGKVFGKRVEVYSVGVGSWTVINEAEYLASRLHEYRPDIVILLMLGNDIMDTHGVTGLGHATGMFSPEVRELGSSTFSLTAPELFGHGLDNGLYYDFVPESRARWEKTFASIARLEEQLHAMGGNMLFSILTVTPYFTAVARHYHVLSRIESPMLRVNFHPLSDMGETSLPHDGHPNRKGHRFAAVHYLHKLSALRWIDTDRSALPDLHTSLSLAPPEVPSPETIALFRRDYARQYLPERIDFSKLDASSVRSIMGGIYPSPDAESSYPFGTLKSAFALRRVAGTRRIVLDIETLPWPRLYPMRLEMYIHGTLADTLELTDLSQSGQHRLSGEMFDIGADEAAIEVMLRANTYVTGITDHRMKSYRLMAVRQE